MVRPTMELLGFARVSLKAGETVRVTFDVAASGLAFLDENMAWRVEAGAFTLKVGGASDRIAQEARFTVTDTRMIDGRHRAFYVKGVRE